ncbi:hypothetical protein JCM24511_00962 [Saitozyma sp. JCM 24511]|nr:hypothetical protein JCM24511_00962 [Saitozyma sp. JCM 24511]
MFRPALTVARPALRRGLATAVPSGSANEFVAKRAEMRAHAVETTDLWRKISFYVCLPGIAVAAIWTYKSEMAHKEHLAWGMQTLFFNPEVNIPAGDAE